MLTLTSPVRPLRVGNVRGRATSGRDVLIPPCWHAYGARRDESSARGGTVLTYEYRDSPCDVEMARGTFADTLFAPGAVTATRSPGSLSSPLRPHSSSALNPRLSTIDRCAREEVSSPRSPPPRLPFHVPSPLALLSQREIILRYEFCDNINDVDLLWREWKWGYGGKSEYIYIYGGVFRGPLQRYVAEAQWLVLL